MADDETESKSGLIEANAEAQAEAEAGEIVETIEETAERLKNITHDDMSSGFTHRIEEFLADVRKMARHILGEG